MTPYRSGTQYYNYFGVDSIGLYYRRDTTTASNPTGMILQAIDAAGHLKYVVNSGGGGGSGGDTSNLIIQNKGVGQQTWYSSGDTLYMKKLGNTYSLNATTGTDSTLKYTIDTSTLFAAVRATIPSAAGAWATVGNSISGGDSTLGTTSNHGFLVKTNNISRGLFNNVGQFLWGYTAMPEPASYKMLVNGAGYFADTLLVRKPGNTIMKMYTTGASTGIISSSAATLTFNGSVIQGTNFGTSGYIQTPSFYTYGSAMTMTTGSTPSNGSSSYFTMTNGNPTTNSGTGYSRLFNINKLTQRGSQDGIEQAIYIDFTVTGTAIDKRAIEVNAGRTLLKGLQTNLVAKTTTYTATDDDNTITVDATGGSFNLTLPTAVGRLGMEYTIKRIDASGNLPTVNTTSSQTIDGSTTYTGLSAQWKYIRVKSDNANWLIIGAN
jgi:hypothetical protein